MLKKSPLFAALAVVLMLSGCFEDEKKSEMSAPAAAETVETGEGALSDAVVTDGGEEKPLAIVADAPAAPSIDVSALTSGEWLLQEIRGNALTAGGAPSMAIDAEGKVSGDSGCNRYFGEARLKPDNRIGFIGIGSTKRACADMARNDQEMRFLSSLTSVYKWQVDEETGLLHLRDAGGSDLLVFAPAAGEGTAGSEESPAAE